MKTILQVFSDNHLHQSRHEKGLIGKSIENHAALPERLRHLDMQGSNRWRSHGGHVLRQL